MTSVSLRRLEDRALAHEVVLQLLRVDEIAVVRDGDLAVRAVDQDRLGVGEAALSGGGIARVTDGGVAGELSSRAELKMSAT